MSRNLNIGKDIKQSESFLIENENFLYQFTEHTSEHHIHALVRFFSCFQFYVTDSKQTLEYIDKFSGII